jgi:hypothetical protein
MDDENCWPEDPADICMIEFHFTGDDEYDTRVHKQANEEHIKLLLREKAITHPNQLPWYDPDLFHVHPSFYSHHNDNRDNKGEKSHLSVSVFSENKNDFMPNILPSRRSNSGEFLFTSTISSSSVISKARSTNGDNKVSSKLKCKVDNADDDLQLLNDTLLNYGIIPKSKEVKQKKAVKVEKVVYDDDDDFEVPLNRVTPNKPRHKRKSSSSSKSSSTHKKSPRLVESKDIWSHVPAATRAVMPPFKKFKFTPPKNKAKDIAHPPALSKVRKGYCMGCKLHPDICHEVLFGEFCVANVMMYYDMHRQDTDIDGINDVYIASYNQALRFKRYEQVKILDYYSNYPPPKCMMDNSYTHGVQLSMFKAKGERFLDAMEVGVNALNRQQNEEE